MSNHVIYVPGLGDSKTYGQNIAIQLWRLFGLKPHYFALGWNKPEGFDNKLSRLLTKIEELESQGHNISLVGISAGASAAINAYAVHRKLTAVICIIGKINNPQTIGRRTYGKNPDFKTSVFRVKDSLAKLKEADTQRIMSIHPWKDQTVPVADTIIKGAKEKTMPGWSHASGLFFGVILGGPSISRFIKNAGK